MKNDLVIDRYNRQELIKEWDQNKLREARVAIVGAGQLGNYTAAALVALGVGGVEIYDNAKVNGEREFLLFKSQRGESKAKGLERMLREINPSAHVKGMDLSLAGSPAIAILGKPNMIIEATNSPDSKKTILDYAREQGIKSISVSADETSGQLYIFRDFERLNYLGSQYLHCNIHFVVLINCFLRSGEFFLIDCAYFNITT